MQSEHFFLENFYLGSSLQQWSLSNAQRRDMNRGPCTCNESVFSLSLCSSDERSTSLYISTASTNSSAGGKGQSNSLCASHVGLTRWAVWITKVWRQRMRRLTETSTKQKVLADKDEIMACVLFELIPMGNWRQRDHKHRKGVLYFWWCGFQPGHWVRTPIVCELLRTPLDISSAGTWGAPPLSWCWEERNTDKPT